MPQQASSQPNAVMSSLCTTHPTNKRKPRITPLGILLNHKRIRMHQRMCLYIHLFQKFDSNCSIKASLSKLIMNLYCMRSTPGSGDCVDEGRFGQLFWSSFEKYFW
jgi:hypothetical protein